MATDLIEINAEAPQKEALDRAAAAVMSGEKPATPIAQKPTLRARPVIGTARRPKAAPNLVVSQSEVQPPMMVPAAAVTIMAAT